MGTPGTAARGGGLAGLPGRPALFWSLACLLAVASWAALALWSASPYARYLEHAGWLDATAFAALCRAVPGGEVLGPAALHAGAWLLMIGAMMLPTSFPLLAMFRRVTGARPDAGALAARVVAGFFVAWIGFGVLAHFADAGLLRLAAGWPWLATHGWIVGAGVLAGAGLFQWSALKYRCLEACRTPFTFVGARWHGRAPGREAFRIGLDHGLFCVGCCWALMLVMFVVGVGSVGWMLALAAVMAAEKNLPWGRRLRTPLGAGLLAWAGAVVLYNV